MMLPVITLLCGSVLIGPVHADVDHSDLSRDQWALEHMDVPEAWDDSRGTGARVALLDTGVHAEHPDLGGAVLEETDVTGQELGPEDGEFGAHGTMMAGIIAARGHGREHDGGVFGVAPEAGLVSIRIAADTDEASAGDAADADEDWVVSGIEHAVAENAQVILLAQGATGSEAEEEAIEAAHTRGVLVVVPGDGPHADTPHTVSVAAVDDQQQLLNNAIDDAAEDMAGEARTADAVSLAAPGQDVITTDLEGGFTDATGTSAAGALVTGVAALIRSEYPQLRPEDVTAALETGVDAPPAASDGEEAAPEYGAGVLNASAALQAADDAAANVPPFDPALAEDSASERPWLLWNAIAAAVVLFVGTVWLALRLRRRGGSRRARRG